MKREFFFAVTGAIGVLFGLGFLLLPEMSLRTYGVATQPHNLMQARYFGSALLAVGLTTFLVRATQDAAAVRALLVGNLAGDCAGALVTLMALGLMNAMAWSSVVLYALFAAGNAYFLFASKPESRAEAA